MVVGAAGVGEERAAVAVGVGVLEEGREAMAVDVDVGAERGGVGMEDVVGCGRGGEEEWGMGG